MINGVAVSQLADGPNTRIKEGDVLALIPPVVVVTKLKKDVMP